MQTRRGKPQSCHRQSSPRRRLDGINNTSAHLGPPACLRAPPRCHQTTRYRAVHIPTWLSLKGYGIEHGYPQGQSHLGLESFLARFFDDVSGSSPFAPRFRSERQSISYKDRRTSQFSRFSVAFHPCCVRTKGFQGKRSRHLPFDKPRGGDCSVVSASNRLRSLSSCRMCLSTVS